MNISNNVMEKSKIIIAADVLPPCDKHSSFTEGKLSEMVSSNLLRRIADANICIINLECVLTDNNLQKSEKIGSHLKAPADCAKLFSKFPNCVVNLANNHILDYGAHGVLDTKASLEKNGIKYVGLNNKSICVNINEIKIGIYSVAEHDFGCSSTCDNIEYPNVVNDAVNLEDIKTLRKQCDRLIVLYHGGIEFYLYPTPKQQIRLRSYIDAGADLVVCQHSHVIGAEEIWNSGKIIYGQGGFLFCERDEIKENLTNSEAMKHGMLIEWDLDNNTTTNIYYERDGVCYLKDSQPERNVELADDKSVMDNWIDYARKHKDAILSVNPRYIEPGKKTLTRIIKREMRLLLEMVSGKSRERLIKSRQTMSCESASELIYTIMELEKHD